MPPRSSPRKAAAPAVGKKTAESELAKAQATEREKQKQRRIAATARFEKEFGCAPPSELLELTLNIHEDARMLTAALIVIQAATRS
jgi:hypothetical protein